MPREMNAPRNATTGHAHALYPWAGRLTGLAVCLQGRMSAVPTTILSFRKYLLDPWNADAFVVAIRDGDEDGLNHSAKLLKRHLSGRLKHLSYDSSSNLFHGLPLEELANPHGAWKTSFHARRPNGRYTALGFARQLLTRWVCADAIFNHETQSDMRYSTYARVRLDTLLFQSVPAMFLTFDSGHEAAVPLGEDYGAQELGALRAINDKMLFGVRRAFLTDASEWQSMLKRTEPLPQGWIPESLHAAHLNMTLRVAGIRRVPLAHCIVAVPGVSCRFGTELAQTLQIVGSGAGELLRKHPHLCDGVLPRPMGTRCDSKRFIQAPRDALKQDPGLCSLAERCMRLLNMGIRPKAL